MQHCTNPRQRYGLLRLPKVTERRDGPRPGDNDDDDDDCTKLQANLASHSKSANYLCLTLSRENDLAPMYNDGWTSRQ